MDQDIKQRFTDVSQFPPESESVNKENEVESDIQATDPVWTNHFESILLTWIVQCKNSNRAITWHELSEMALFLNEKFHGPVDFSKSAGWLINFCKRHNVEFILQGETLKLAVAENQRERIKENISDNADVNDEQVKKQL